MLKRRIEGLRDRVKVEGQAHSSLKLINLSSTLLDNYSGAAARRGAGASEAGGSVMRPAGGAFTAGLGSRKGQPGGPDVMMGGACKHLGETGEAGLGG